MHDTDTRGQKLAVTDELRSWLARRYPGIYEAVQKHQLSHLWVWTSPRRCKLTFPHISPDESTEFDSSFATVDAVKIVNAPLDVLLSSPQPAAALNPAVYEGAVLYADREIYRRISPTNARLLAGDARVLVLRVLAVRPVYGVTRFVDLASQAAPAARVTEDIFTIENNPDVFWSLDTSAAPNVRDPRELEETLP